MDALKVCGGGNGNVDSMRSSKTSCPFRMPLHTSRHELAHMAQIREGKLYNSCLHAGRGMLPRPAWSFPPHTMKRLPAPTFRFSAG